MDNNEILNEAFEKYGLSYNLFFLFPTDTTSVMPATANIMGVIWFGCVGHKLQLAGNEALSQQTMVKTLIRDCHRLAKFFHLSSFCLRTLNMKQNELGLKETSSPMMSSPAGIVPMSS